jgi:two-component sensor histidine kinase
MEQLLSRLPPKPKSVAVRIAITTALVGTCFLVMLALRSSENLLGFYLFFPAIFAASILFDRGSGIYGTLLSAVLLYMQLTPPGRVLLPPEYAAHVILLVFIALGVAVVSEGLRTAWDRAVAAERGKDLLLQELGHRTRNNLTLVTSVLSLQARLKANPETQQALEKAISRVQAIASAHEHFKPLSRGGNVEMRSYLEDLCTHLGDALRDIRPIAVTVDADEIQLRTEQAVALGLIANELVTNALKHAFPDDRSGRVSVSLKRDGGAFSLVVADDGVGCPRAREERMGSRLTRLLAQQLGGTIDWEPAETGCRVRMQFAPPE